MTIRQRVKLTFTEWCRVKPLTLKVKQAQESSQPVLHRLGFSLPMRMYDQHVLYVKLVRTVITRRRNSPILWVCLVFAMPVQYGLNEKSPLTMLAQNSGLLCSR